MLWSGTSINIRQAILEVDKTGMCHFKGTESLPISHVEVRSTARQDILKHGLPLGL